MIFTSVLYYKMKRLNRDAVKYIAIFAMLLDHIAWLFLPSSSATAQIFHTVGRTTAPIMCFFLAEGYYYTKSKKKYAERLFIFALVSQIPWWLMHGGAISLSFNMIFTLFFALLAVHVEAKTENKLEKFILIAILTALTYFCDWRFFAILWCVGFYRYREDEKKKYLWFTVVSICYFAYTVYRNYTVSDIGIYHSVISSLFTFGTFLSIPVLLCYNGQKGKTKWGKWVFYLFYPLHIMVLVLIQNFIGVTK